MENNQILASIRREARWLFKRIEETESNTLIAADQPTIRNFGPVLIFVSAGFGTGFASQFLWLGMIRSSNTMAKWFKAAFHPLIGIVHRFDASWIAR